MRLIDADAFLENNKELADCDFIHPKYCDTLRDLVNNAPTVDVLEQIRAEIKAEMDDIASGCVAKYSHDEGYYSGLSWVLRKIDKYKGDKE